MRSTGADRPVVVMKAGNAAAFGVQLDIAKKEKGKDWELYRLKSRINITGVQLATAGDG